MKDLTKYFTETLISANKTMPKTSPSDSIHSGSMMAVRLQSVCIRLHYADLTKNSLLPI